MSEIASELRRGAVRRVRPARGLLALAAGAALVVAFAAAPPRTMAADTALQITTPYPAVQVAPGAHQTFTLNVRTATAERVDLKVANVPDGWKATLQGGGNDIAGVMTDPSSPPAVTLNVTVPDNAAANTYTVRVVGTAGAETASLDVSLTVSAQAGGQVSMKADYEQLQGASGASFSFNLTLTNDTPQDHTFAISSKGPSGWTVTARPSGQEQATSIAVQAGSSGTISVSVAAPQEATAGDYEIDVQALAGDLSAAQKLTVTITGSYAMTLATSDQRLNISGSAGSPMTQTLVVTNSGTSELQNVAMTATPPSGWTVKFDPSTIASIPAGQTANVTVTVTASNDALAGDYSVTYTATAGDTTAKQDIRATIETSQMWMVVGIGLIVLTLCGLAYVFRRYGRR